MNNVLCVLVLIATVAVVDGLSNKTGCIVVFCETTFVYSLCKSDPQIIDPECDKVYSAGVTREERNEILDVHNEVRERARSGQELGGSRSRLQPAAKNLEPLKWDKTLARMAQNWANKCATYPDPCLETNKFQVGQSASYWQDAFLPHDDMTPTKLIRNWYGEVSSFNPSRVKPFTPYNETENYTRMVWAKTTRIGCGIIRFNRYRLPGPTKYNMTTLICNYSPRGNINGESVYEPVQKKIVDRV